MDRKLIIQEEDNKDVEVVEEDIDDLPLTSGETELDIDRFEEWVPELYEMEITQTKEDEMGNNDKNENDMEDERNSEEKSEENEFEKKDEKDKVRKKKKMENWKWKLKLDPSSFTKMK